MITKILKAIINMFYLIVITILFLISLYKFVSIDSPIASAIMISGYMIYIGIWAK